MTPAAPGLLAACSRQAAGRESLAGPAWALFPPCDAGRGLQDFPGKGPSPEGNQDEPSARNFGPAAKAAKGHHRAAEGAA